MTDVCTASVEEQRSLSKWNVVIKPSDQNPRFMMTITTQTTTTIFTISFNNGAWTHLRIQRSRLLHTDRSLQRTLHNSAVFERHNSSFPPFYSSLFTIMAETCRKVITSLKILTKKSTMSSLFTTLLQNNRPTKQVKLEHYLTINNNILTYILFVLSDFIKISATKSTASIIDTNYKLRNHAIRLAYILALIVLLRQPQNYWKLVSRTVWVLGLSVDWCVCAVSLIQTRKPS